MNATWQPSPLDGTWPPWEALRTAQVNRIYFAARYPTFEDGQWVWHDNTRQLARGYRDAVVGEQKFQYGIWRDPHHDGIHDYQLLANLVDEDIAKATGGNKYVSCSYMLDMEFGYRDGAWLVALFKAIRKLRPGRLLSWTMEPMQGGWIKQFPALVDFINRDVNMVVVAQTFGGAMDPYPLDQVRADMVATGIDPRRVRLFYDAAHPRPAGWNGCLFHNGRLRNFAPSLARIDERNRLAAPPEHLLDRYRRERLAESA